MLRLSNFQTREIMNFKYFEKMVGTKKMQKNQVSCGDIETMLPTALTESA